jgi:hypothetical protein
MNQATERKSTRADEQESNSTSTVKRFGTLLQLLQSQPMNTINPRVPTAIPIRKEKNNAQ